MTKNINALSYGYPVLNYAYQVAKAYAKYDKYGKCYTLDVTDIPDFELDKLVALICRENPDLGSEATGPDNDRFKQAMLPAMIKYMINSVNTENETDFAREWIAGVRAYFAKYILKDIMAISIESYNENFLPSED